MIQLILIGICFFDAPQANAGAPMLRRTPDGPDLGFYEITRRDGASSITLHTADVASNRWDAVEIAIPEAGESRSLQHPAGNFRSNA